jgi:hypothetical protein
MRKIVISTLAIAGALIVTIANNHTAAAQSQSCKGWQSDANAMCRRGSGDAFVYGQCISLRSEWKYTGDGPNDGLHSKLWIYEGFCYYG